MSYLDKRIQARKAHFAALQKKADELQAVAKSQEERCWSGRKRHSFIKVEKSPDGGGGERVRLLIPGNPNQIFGMTPADIDK